nr:MAG TPA: 50S ribosomal subunit [Caudoviricetes sp.]
MKENNVIRLSVCPRCGRSFCEPPALSRLDNETLICPDCGTREALDAIGIDAEEQEQILAAIHRCRQSE